MEEGTHTHGHAPHGTGFRWLDLVLALSADGRGTRPALYLSLANTGIGPARLRSVELSFLRDHEHREPVRVRACPQAAVPYTGG
jgi:hypothetical protein